ncbi:hypothetical protein [Streptomyces spinosirectus]
MTDQPAKTRPGDQPLPAGGQECVQDALIALIEERKQLGIQRYGSPLMTHNGRDAGRDAVEEALDLTVYSMQVAMELRDLRGVVEQVRALRDDLRGITGARWVADALDKILDPPATEATDHSCTDNCKGVTGIRGLLEHVGIDTSGQDITVNGRLVEPARKTPDNPTTSSTGADNLPKEP